MTGPMSFVSIVLFSQGAPIGAAPSAISTTFMTPPYCGEAAFTLEMENRNMIKKISVRPTICLTDAFILSIVKPPFFYGSTA
jgi:hypothetical protein